MGKLAVVMGRGEWYVLKQWVDLGLVVEFESLLSTIGGELGMLGDYDGVVSVLLGGLGGGVEIRLVEGDEEEFGVVLEEGGGGGHDDEKMGGGGGRYGGGDRVLGMKKEVERRKEVDEEEEEIQQDQEEREEIKEGEHSEEPLEEQEEEERPPLFVITITIPSTQWKSALLSPAFSLVPSSPDSLSIELVAVLFSQGINEQQSKAILKGETTLQV